MIGFFLELLTVKQLTAYSHLAPLFYRKSGRGVKGLSKYLGPGHFSWLWIAFRRSSGTLTPSFCAAFRWFQARSYLPSR